MRNNQWRFIKQCSVVWLIRDDLRFKFRKLKFTYFNPQIYLCFRALIQLLVLFVRLISQWQATGCASS